ncbi:hypothetical protein C2845_PM15G04680 [Panicum miliaceum]|uniref:Uncharacterized protein n=1 Tax=Panicum miliaceum TaxID=4540 RepID=A0A3L6Q5J8_PANMI|nr:hypothetical protein C2845_PM15G04680 [Panicum miliaceum]
MSTRCSSRVGIPYTCRGCALSPPSNTACRSIPKPSSLDDTAATSKLLGPSITSRERQQHYPPHLPPRTLKDEFHLAEKKDEIEAVLAKIEGIYSRVKLDKELVVGNGFCFGLLDPATNILVNSVIANTKAAAAAAPPTDGGRRGRKRPAGRDMNQRSLDGLVAFLTCLFPYLPDAEARAYLDAAELDPLVAALLVVNRRGMRQFGFCSGTTVAAVDTALRCAAVAANHPDPSRLVLGWKLLSHGLQKFVSEMSSNKSDTTVARHVLSMVKFTGGSDTELQLKEPWELAERRLHDNPIGKELPPARAAAKRMLLATIHGFLLQALARLPTAELSSRYHRSMLDGGYCYGPLDPVSNIIVNTVWYDRSFLDSKQVTLDMISTVCLWRVAARSLYGLLSFLCTRYPNLSPDQALQRLLVARANLQVADPNLFDVPDTDRDCKLRWPADRMQTGHGSHGTCEMQREAVEASTRSACVSEAYAAAATATFHRNPLAQKEFLGSPDVVSKLRVASEVLHLQDGHPLSPQDLEFLSMSLLKCSSSTSKSCQQQDLAPTKIRKSLYSYKSQCSYRFWGQHERVRSMVKAALDKFNETMEDRPFRLHIICSANEFVSGPVPSIGEEVGEYNPWTPHKYYHSHINFLAVCKGRPCDPPTLFFAECGKDGDDTCWCVPVTRQEPDAEQVRCVYCEHEGDRIVHPAVGSFHGRDEFAKLFYLSDRKFYSNNKIITDKRASVDKRQ